MTVDKELFADTLPTYLTRFVGRDREIARVLSMLHPGRLVTICGVGGAGKTRVAIEVAKRSRARSRMIENHGEVYWVPLGAVVDPSQVPAAIATGIGVTGAVGDRALAPVVRALSDRYSLLVLDNCEQVGAACRELLASLLIACPTVTVLATTSRVPLALPAEEVGREHPDGSRTRGRFSVRQSMTTDSKVTRAARFATSAAKDQGPGSELSTKPLLATMRVSAALGVLDTGSVSPPSQRLQGECHASLVLA